MLFLHQERLQLLPIEIDLTAYSKEKHDSDRNTNHFRQREANSITFDHTHHRQLDPSPNELRGNLKFATAFPAAFLRGSAAAAKRRPCHREATELRRPGVYSCCANDRKGPRGKKETCLSHRPPPENFFSFKMNDSRIVPAHDDSSITLIRRARTPY